MANTDEWVESEPPLRVKRASAITTRGARREIEVLSDGQILVREGLVTDESQSATMRTPITHQVGSEDECRTAVQRDQTCEQPQQRRLAGTVRSR